jgi:hypothetical protein
MEPAMTVAGDRAAMGGRRHRQPAGSARMIGRAAIALD